MEDREKAFQFYSNCSEKALKDFNKEASIICFYKYLRTALQSTKSTQMLSKLSPSMDNL